jgi:hypothetical protein
MKGFVVGIYFYQFHDMGEVMSSIVSIFLWYRIFPNRKRKDKEGR